LEKKRQNAFAQAATLQHRQVEKEVDTEIREKGFKKIRTKVHIPIHNASTNLQSMNKGEIKKTREKRIAKKKEKGARPQNQFIRRQLERTRVPD